MCVLDDVCATMHAVSEGADMKFVEVGFQYALEILWFKLQIS